MDNARVDLTLERLINPQLKGSNLFRDSNSITAVNIKYKANICALMVNGYVDLFDASVAKIFAGAGVGLAQVKEKISSSVQRVNLLSKSAFNNTKFSSTKKANNFAYQFTLGVATEIKSVNVELFYKWADYGKTGKIKNADVSVKTAYKGHSIGAGVRFDI